MSPVVERDLFLQCAYYAEGYLMRRHLLDEALPVQRVLCISLNNDSLYEPSTNIVHFVCISDSYYYPTYLTYSIHKVYSISSSNTVL